MQRILSPYIMRYSQLVVTFSRAFVRLFVHSFIRSFVRFYSFIYSISLIHSILLDLPFIPHSCFHSLCFSFVHPFAASKAVGASPDSSQGKHRRAFCQSKRSASVLHLPTQVGGICADGRHGLRHAVRRKTDARHFRDRHPPLLGAVGRQMPFPLQDDRQEDVAIHVAAQAIQGLHEFSCQFGFPLAVILVGTLGKINIP